jgi:asparaginyl-tRNA synthetase
MKQGWIKSIRQSKGLIFVAVTDGAKDFQVTIVEAECKITGELKVGASFEAQGKDSKTPKGLFEFLASDFKIVGSADDSYPIQPKAHSDDFLRTIPDLRGRAKKFQAIWKVRHHLTQAIHKYFDRQGFYQYYTPIITTADCEGAGETFQVKTDWLDEKLTVSGQLHGEVGMMSLGKIYTFSPCFRAEKSATKKHLSEFWMIEPEMAFYDLDKTIKLAEDFIKSVVMDVITTLEHRYDKPCEEGFFFKKLAIEDAHISYICGLMQKAWKVVRYDEVAELFGVQWGDDISSEVEKKIVEYYKVPTFITHYPKDLKPFYMKKDDRVAYCFDLIFPEVGELIGGSQREDSYEVLDATMSELGLDMEKMQWYLNTRKWGSVPHAGFGLGFERLLMFITKASKIHDVIPFPVSF